MAGKMVPIAHIVSRSEALVVASMLDAAGIIVRISGEAHASVSVNSVALGHYLLTVPDWQHDDASQIVAETFAASDWQFSEGLQTAVIKLLLANLDSAYAVLLLTTMKIGLSSPLYLGLPFLMLFSTPANPQGRSDYYLAETSR